MTYPCPSRHDWWDYAVIKVYGYRVQLTTHALRLMARNATEARLSALELAGPDAQVLSCVREVDW